MVSRLKLLSLSTLYPTPADPGAGVFIRSRLLHLAELADLCVLVPVALLRYSGGRKGLWNHSGEPRSHRLDGKLQVVFSRWIYPPSSGAFAALCLFVCLLVPVLRLRRRFAFHLVDAHFAHPEGIAAALLSLVFGYPYAITLRGCEIDHARSPLRRFAMSAALRRAGHVITVSENLRRFALGLGVSPGRVTTVPNGVDPAVFYPRDRHALREKLAIPPERRVILTAGHLIELKGHHHVIRALRTLLDHGLDAGLLIAGGAGRSPGYDHTIHALIQELGLQDRVRLLGQVSPETLAGLMSAADVFCLASSREGWPNVVHEALSCGTPVVATLVGAVPEMIPSPDYGLTWPAEEVAALHIPLEEALRKPWDRDAIAAWGRARSWPQVAREVLGILRSVAGREAS